MPCSAAVVVRRRVEEPVEQRDVVLTTAHVVRGPERVVGPGLSSLRREIVSVSIEWPKRYTAWANSALIAGLSSVWVKANGSKGLIAGWTLRANSSNTRCWYSISVTKRAAWKSRSP